MTERREPCIAINYDERYLGDGAFAEIKAGNLGTERIVPPAGEEHAFDVERWKRHVEVYVSPTGRSVRVWVDGEEIKPRKEEG